MGVLKEKGFKFDICFTSVLRRAIKTCWTVCMESENFSMPIVNTWRLNERHYGGLQGLNKADTAAKYGDEQVKIWRRSYDIPPPNIDEDSDMNPANDPKYADLDPKDIPRTECLKDVVSRFLPLWESEIVPDIRAGKRVIIAAHGNSL